MIIFFSLDCMDIVIQNMLQSMLQRNPLTSTGSSNRAHIEELPSDTVSTFSEDGQCYTCGMIFTYVRSGIYCMLYFTSNINFDCYSNCYNF